MSEKDQALIRDRLSAVGSLASIACHGARNRLAGVRAALEFLHAGMEAGMTQEYRTAILREFDRFVSDFNLGTDMVRSTFREIEDVSAREAIEDALRPFDGVEIATRFAHENDLMAVDRRLFRLTLLNLLRNASQAVGDRAGTRIDVSTSNEDCWLHVEISDNGPGLPAVIHDRLMQENGVSGAEVLGLGLSLSLDAMKLMGGKLACLSPRGGPGARFRVSAPLARSDR